eukprot:g2846.t1
MTEQRAMEEKFCEVMRRTEQYLILMDRISEQMKKGYFELAQAKYSMGTTSLSSCNYNSEMVATQRLMYVTGIDDEDSAWQLASSPLVDDQKTKDLASTDPLHWFGVLVPPSLRHSQKSFKSVIPLIVEIANHAQYINNATKEITVTEPAHEVDENF